MLPALQLCLELSTSWAQGPLVWHRPGEKRQEQVP